MRESPFERHPGFYTEDNRKFRTYNPITKESLERRFEVLAPEWAVSGKRVLDLGSCLGAFWQWCLHYGAKSYTGVEIQSEYAETSRRLLVHHGGKVRIVESTIEDFFEECQEEYDLVAVLGVLYAFVDYYAILKAIAKRCNETVLIDSLWPWKEMVSLDAPAVAFVTNQGINLASTHWAVSGYGSRITPSWLKVVMSTLGFTCDEPELKPRRLNRDSDVYNADPETVGAARFLMRFRKTDRMIPTIGEWLARKKPVLGFMKWSDTPSYDTAKGDVSWKFDGKNAGNFQKIAETNIPDYERVIDLCVSVAQKRYSQNEPIIDVGSALGHTLQKFSEAGFSHLLGVESSHDMVSASQYSGEVIISDEFPKDRWPFSLVLINWTLHFIKEREWYLLDVYEGLREGGTLILTDKILGSSTTLELYHDFKRKSWLNDDQIRKKEESIRGVLVPYPLTWYFETIRKAGFSSIEILNAAPSFTTFLITK